MILENTIVNALKYFGCMDKVEIQDKLKLINVHVELRDLDDAIRLLLIHKLVKCIDFDAKRYIAK